jgi:hypothetical protein
MSAPGRVSGVHAKEKGAADATPFWLPVICRYPA